MISSAHITTFGERAVDVFYVKDLFGSRVTQEAKLETIRKRLLAALEESEPAPIEIKAAKPTEAGKAKQAPRKRKVAAKAGAGPKGRAGAVAR